MVEKTVKDNNNNKVEEIKTEPKKVHVPTKDGSGAYNSEGIRVCD